MSAALISCAKYVSGADSLVEDVLGLESVFASRGSVLCDVVHVAVIELLMKFSSVVLLGGSVVVFEVGQLACDGSADVAQEIAVVDRLSEQEGHCLRKLTWPLSSWGMVSSFLACRA